MKRLIFILLAAVQMQGFAQTAVSERSTVNTKATNSNSTSAKAATPAFENMSVFRIQLRLTTGTSNDAGSNDPVHVQMNSADKKFYLVKGVDNFQEGKTVTYDVLSNAIKKVKDIEFIRFGVTGDDGACIKKVELLLNGNTTPVFTKTYAANTGACFDNGSSSLPATVEIPGNQLRADKEWSFTPAHVNMWKPPVKISKEWILSAVEGSIGNQIYHQGGKLKWGTKGTINSTLWNEAVEMARKNDHTLHFDLDLQRDVTGPNPEIDIDFDLDFGCDNDKVKMTVENLVVSTNWVGDVRKFILEKGASLVGGALTVATGGVAFPTIASSFLLRLFESFRVPEVGQAGINAGCKKIKVTEDGDILFQ